MSTKRTRLTLQIKLEDLLGSKHVYYQPPENLKMEYPAIRYSKSDEEDIYANNLMDDENEEMLRSMGLA